MTTTVRNKKNGKIGILVKEEGSRIQVAYGNLEVWGNKENFEFLNPESPNQIVIGNGNVGNKANIVGNVKKPPDRCEVCGRMVLEVDKITDDCICPKCVADAEEAAEIRAYQKEVIRFVNSQEFRDMPKPPPPTPTVWCGLKSTGIPHDDANCDCHLCGQTVKGRNIMFFPPIDSDYYHCQLCRNCVAKHDPEYEATQAFEELCDIFSAEAKKLTDQFLAQIRNKATPYQQIGEEYRKLCESPFGQGADWENINKAIRKRFGQFDLELIQEYVATDDMPFFDPEEIMIRLAYATQQTPRLSLTSPYPNCQITGVTWENKLWKSTTALTEAKPVNTESKAGLPLGT